MEVKNMGEFKPRIDEAMAENPILRECATVTDGESMRVALRTDDYEQSLEKIERLVAAARADFPDLTSDQVKIEFYGGSSTKRQIGIEFNLPNWVAIPDEYQRRNSLEPTM